MKLLLVISTALLVATAAFAGTSSYGWEDGTGTILGFFGNVGTAANVTSPVYAGGHSLYLQEAPIGGTPQAYVAYIEGCLDGDIIDADFWCYDVTEGGFPSGRIWAHFGYDGDVNAYGGSAGGNGTYSDGLGWSDLAWSWTFVTEDPTYGTRTAMIIEARIYSADGLDDMNVDQITVTAPDHCTVTFPGQDPTSTEATTWGSVKSLFR
ncbi:MAG: hypothetical protein ABIK65_00450 [Candidatus Eisenbacteria bacterium]